MAIGIICAISEEIDLLKKDITLKSKTLIANREFFEGTLYGKEVVLVKSAIGKVASTMTATILINNFEVESVIFCGVAGALDKDLNVGDVVIGDKSVQHDYYTPVYPDFYLDSIGISYIPSDRELCSKAYDSAKLYIEKELKSDIPQKYLDLFHINNPKVVVGTVASGDQFIDDSKVSLNLSEKVENAKCVEMEGAAVAQVCYEFKIPYVVIRVISDSANDDANVDFITFVEEAACHFTRGTIKAILKG